MKNTTTTFISLFLLLITSIAIAAPYPAPFFNGFENGVDIGDVDRMLTVTRVASGTAGISSADGAWHAQAAVTDFGAPDGFVFTRYGGYGDEFPEEGYTTSIDVYLDMAESPYGEDFRLDWSSAISTPAGGHRRDFIFHVGTDEEGNFVISVSNNAPGWPANPGRDPLYLADLGLGTGWYTLQHSFYDDVGILAVDMSVLDAGGNVLATWTLSDLSDEIGITVGGNRYGWLVTNDFSTLELDNIIRSGRTPENQDDCKNGEWENLYRADGTMFKNQGDCIQYVNTGI